ncbi:hypothetical protein KR222_009038 [Zaprionus bogoriensis]|nr:hypothetical protein KR222_009038 [Zaprionus bogoriensis]
MDMPAYTQQTATQTRQFRHHKQRQLSGTTAAVTDLAYENQLAAAGSSEDELDHADVVVVGGNEVVAAVAAIAASSKARELRNRSNNRSGSYSNLFDVDFDATLTAPTDGHNHKSCSAGAALLAAAINGVEQQPQRSATLGKSNSQTENMYSNVPSAASADAALHVYSNIMDAQQQQQQQQSKQLQQLQQQQQQRQRQHCEQQQLQAANAVLSSTLLSDDLDLDDPVSASFVGQRKALAIGDGGGGGEQVKSADRLRMLHDTTMIDTALDLDSLDGSSMGNSSQSCLVKAGGKSAPATAAGAAGPGPIV